MSDSASSPPPSGSRKAPAAAPKGSTGPGRSAAGHGDRGAGTRPAGGAGRRPQAGRVRDGRLAFVHTFAQLYLEVESGRRRPALLHRYMDTDLVDRLAGQWVRGGPPGSVRCVSGMASGPCRFDAVAIVQCGERAGALVIQLVRDHSGWRVTEAARPEQAMAAER